MLSIVLYAVLGGALLGVIVSLLLGRHWPTRLFALIGALGGGFGLITYDIIIMTMQVPPKFFWDGLSWAVLGIVFGLAVLIVSLSGQNSHESRRDSR